jgi:hypothetical protein
MGDLLSNDTLDMGRALLAAARCARPLIQIKVRARRYATI